jgi:acyl-CoA reductase-like NAD-dependent aldehyde dehydrogenase
MNGLGARYEAAGCAAWVRATASTPLPVEVLVDDGNSHAELHYRPIGVVGAITPWNWPMIIACWQIAPALRMGNTVVQKPSEYTTLTGLAIAAVLNDRDEGHRGVGGGHAPAHPGAWRQRRGHRAA